MKPLRNKFSPRSLALAAFVVTLAYASVAQAQLVTYNFNSLGAVAAPGPFTSTGAVTGLTASTLSAGAGITLQSTNTGLGYSSVVIQANSIDFTTGRAGGIAPADTDFFSFTLTPDSGKALDLTSFSFDSARGGSSTARGFDVRSSADGFTSSLITADSALQRPNLTNTSISLTSFANMETAITFRVYLYSTSAGSSIEFDNFVVNGSVVDAAAAPIPEPAAAGILLGLGALSIGGLQRRRR